MIYVFSLRGRKYIDSNAVLGRLPTEGIKEHKVSIFPVFRPLSGKQKFTESAERRINLRVLRVSAVNICLFCHMLSYYDTNSREENGFPIEPFGNDGI
jgi:hypothetical protein